MRRSAFPLLVLALCAAGRAEPPRIALITHGQASDPFWSVVKNGAERAAAEQGVELEYLAPASFDVIAMARLIGAAVASRPAGLVVTIPDAAALREAIGAAVGAGIPVVSVNSGAEASRELGALLHVGQAELEAGRRGGERMAAAGVGRAACVNHEVGNAALDRRCEGFARGLAGRVDVLATSLDPTELRSAVSAHLMRHPDTQGVLTLGAAAAEAALAALEEDDLLSRVKLATFDLSPAVLAALARGKLLFALDQQPFLQGYLPVALLALYLRYGVIPASDVLTGPGFVTPQDAARVSELSARGVR